MSQLAIDGGAPVRATLLPTGFIGTRLLGEEEKAEVLAVLEAHALSRVSGMTPPTRVEAFERELCRRTGSRYAVAVTSGTAALEVALAGVGIGPGDEVIMPALNFISSPEVVLRLGAVPVFGEVDEGYGLVPEEIDRLATARTKAVMPLHVHGAACRIDEIVAAARRRGLLVLENGAWSCGATYRGKAVGTFGEAGIYSLQSVKVLTAGEGGVVLTGDPVVYERAFRYHDHGNLRLTAIPESLGGDSAGAAGQASEPQLEPFIGAAFRMNELTGAVALAQVRKLEGLLETVRRAQRTILDGVRAVVDGFPQGSAPFSLRDVPDPKGDCGIAVGLNFRDAETAQRYQAALRAEGVPLSGLYGGRPVYVLPQMRSLCPVWTNGAPLLRGETPAYGEGLCPRTEELMARVLLLSVTPAYTDADAEDAVWAISKVAATLK